MYDERIYCTEERRRPVATLTRQARTPDTSNAITSRSHHQVQQETGTAHSLRTRITIKKQAMFRSRLHPTPLVPHPLIATTHVRRRTWEAKELSTLDLREADEMTRLVMTAQVRALLTWWMVPLRKDWINRGSFLHPRRIDAVPGIELCILHVRFGLVG